MTSEQNTIKNPKDRTNSKSKPDPAVKKEFVKQGVLLEARRLKGKTHKGAVLLNDISLSVHPGELVILAGPEGSGKSALIHALAGIHRASDGEVLINDVKLHENYKSLRTQIGFVPREDIAHQDLTVFEVLDYASRLRLPRGTPSEERRNRVEEVLNELNLGEMRAFRIRGLNTGIKKLVSVAIELITDPGILFLDDPFLSLDVPSASYLFHLLRWISDQGLPVVLTTRSAEFLGQADKVAFLTRNRSLAWFGPPGEALEYFAAYRGEPGQNNESLGFAEVYDLLDDPRLGSPQDWAGRYLAAPANRKYAGGGSKEIKPELALDERPLARRRARLGEGQLLAVPKPVPTISQWIVLSLRNLKLLARDRTGLFLMLVAPLLIAWIDLIFSSRQMYDLTLGDPERISISLALLIFFAMALGSISWIREFQKEAAIYRRERQVTLQIFPYVMSKVWVVGLLALYQGLVWMLVHFIASALPFEISLVVNFYVFLALVVFAGGILGLFASFVMSSEKKALLLLSVFLIPQLIFSGALLPFSKLNPVIRSLASVMPSHLAFEGLSTADGHGKVLAGDSCWQLPQEQRQGLTDQQKQVFCSCMGINIFSLCNFPGILRFYNQALAQPEPIMPTPDQAFKFPDPPTPAPGETLEQYAQNVRDSFAIELESNLATSGIYQSKLTQYMDDLTAWETARNSAISKAESQLEQEFNNFASVYNANLPNLLLGLVGESIILVLVLMVSVKRKDIA